MNRRWLRWMPAVAVPAVIAGALVSPTLAGAAVDLPDKTPEQVLALAAQSSADQLSGTIEQSSSLGLPELPTTGPSANDDVTAALELLTGSHSARVYLDGPGNARVQVMDTLGERDIVRRAATCGCTAPTTTPPSTSPCQRTPPSRGGPSEVPTPQGLAHRLLSALDSTTKVRGRGHRGRRTHRVQPHHDAAEPDDPGRVRVDHRRLRDRPAAQREHCGPRAERARVRVGVHVADTGCAECRPVRLRAAGRKQRQGSDSAEPRRDRRPPPADGTAASLESSAPAGTRSSRCPPRRCRRNSSLRRCSPGPPVPLPAAGSSAPHW